MKKIIFTTLIIASCYFVNAQDVMKVLKSRQTDQVVFIPDSVPPNTTYRVVTDKNSKALVPLTEEERKAALAKKPLKPATPATARKEGAE
ncbi:MAG: hypothetical protein IAF38_00425 [Bacteroidia bacterium]|nr:hypothetical protein [Bacteroidia bacterium]